MELTYTNKSREDLGYLDFFSLDLAFGSDENNFTLETSLSDNPLEEGSIIYILDTEYGGIVDGFKVDTKKNLITYNGRTWRGFFENKTLCPASGQNYYTVSGNANTVMAQIISKLSLGELFQADSVASSINITSYQFDWYCDALSGINAMLKKCNAKLLLSFNGSKVVCSVVPLTDYSQDEQWDKDQFAFTIDKKYKGVNHVICIGGFPRDENDKEVTEGENKDRIVRHLYCNSSGVISQTQSLFGINEFTYVFISEKESEVSELIEKGTQKLEDLKAKSTLKSSFTSEDYSYDIGDLVSAKESITGESVVNYISKKVLKIKNGTITINCEVK